MRLIPLTLALLSPAALAIPQAIGTGASRATAPGVIASSWVGMGAGWPSHLIATPIAGPADATTIADLLLGRFFPRQVSLHGRAQIDRDQDGQVTIADVVRAANP